MYSTLQSFVLVPGMRKAKAKHSSFKRTELQSPQSAAATCAGPSVQAWQEGDLTWVSDLTRRGLASHTHTHPGAWETWKTLTSGGRAETEGRSLVAILASQP